MNYAFSIRFLYCLLLKLRWAWGLLIGVEGGKNDIKPNLLEGLDITAFGLLETKTI